jgi:enamine deaminase RidA (YjgF/YER057c/UK114 family)
VNRPGLDPAHAPNTDATSLGRQAILGVCDSSLALTLRATVFLTSLEHAQSVLRVWKEATAPAASCATQSSVSIVQVSSLPRGALVEFQVSALTNRAAMHLQVRAALFVRAHVV